VTSLANTLQDAVENSAMIMDVIDFEDKYFRPDIGYEFLDTTSNNN
jgi:phosphoribosylamine--glycine ligase